MSYRVFDTIYWYNLNIAEINMHYFFYRRTIKNYDKIGY